MWIVLMFRRAPQAREYLASGLPQALTYIITLVMSV